MHELVDTKPEPVKGTLATQLRQYLSDEGFSHSDRIPPERDLMAVFGVTRFAMRKALAQLEKDGLIWRHVGRGTFVGARPVHNLHDLAYLKDLARPKQLLEARMAIEPELARLAATNGVSADFDHIQSWIKRSRDARDWRSYEASDTNLHNAIARASHNKLLIHLFDELNTVRRAIVWNQRRESATPPKSHPSFDQHDVLVAAIEARDASAAARAMRVHLRSVRDNLLRSMN